jgi:hypothetical protein
MKRGSRFFVEYSQAAQQGSENAKGRSFALLEKRNEKLFHRYYYYTRILQYNYPKTMEALVRDFDISESTIIQLIEKNTERVKEIGLVKPTVKRLKEMFPSFSWAGKVQNITMVEKEIFVLS